MSDSNSDNTRKSLHQLIYESFQPNEIKVLCANIGFPVYEIINDSLADTVFKLLEYVRTNDTNNKLLRKLIDECRDQRSLITWPDPKKVVLSLHTELFMESRREQEALYKDLLRPERVPAYRKLWSLFEPLAKYSPPGPFTYAQAEILSNNMRHWYFDNGAGMFFSEMSRQAYFPVQEYLIDTILNDEALKKDPYNALPDDIIETLRRLGSLLRASLAEEVGIGRMTFDAGTETLPDTTGAQPPQTSSGHG